MFIRREIWCSMIRGLNKSKSTTTHANVHMLFIHRCTPSRQVPPPTHTPPPPPPPPSPPLIWQSRCNLGLKRLFFKMPWALGSWYFPLITVPRYHHKALSTSLPLLITLFRLLWHILSFAWCTLHANATNGEERAKEGKRDSAAQATCPH